MQSTVSLHSLLYNIVRIVALIFFATNSSYEQLAVTWAVAENSAAIAWTLVVRSNDLQMTFLSSYFQRVNIGSDYKKLPGSLESVREIIYEVGYLT